MFRLNNGLLEDRLLACVVTSLTRTSVLDLSGASPSFERARDS